MLLQQKVITVLLLYAAGTIAGELAKEIHGGGGIVLPPPPVTEAKPVTEDIHGTKVIDPYRWLEDGQSQATRAWIGAQMKYTDLYLSQVKIRPEIEKRVGELERQDVYTTPIEGRGKYFFRKRLAEENQGSIYGRSGLQGKDELLVDVRKVSQDENTSLVINDVSKDGELLAYGVREGGQDEISVHFLNVSDRRELPDVLPTARYGVSLAPDKKGLFYSKVEKSGTIVYYHKFGADVASDEVVFGKKFKDETFGPMDWISAEVTENDRYLVLSVGHGVPAKRMDIYAKDLREANAPIREMVHGIDNRFYAQNDGDALYVTTDYKADNYRVIKVNMNDPAPEKWQTVVQQGKDAIEETTIVGGKLFVTVVHDAVTQTKVYSLDGALVGELKFPGLGTASAVQGRATSREGFYSYRSFTVPETIYHYDTQSGATEVFAKPTVPFKSEEYETKQIFATSKDGTKVPVFIVSRKGLKADEPRPLLLTGYGGFDISNTPYWNSEIAWWLEQGGYFALPNLRGGGEYGEAWHRAGMFEMKQNVFDDLFAAAEYLIANRYTSPSLFAIIGRSNGGLLMGAAMTQRPELFGAIDCGYPLLDMLRYQNFLIGKWWTTEYGSSENADQFGYLLKYSPYQNVKAGTKYPSIMFVTGDSDTRVDPLHARKMTALIQASSGGDRPILLHYETQAGHSFGVSVKQRVSDVSDDLAFLWNETAGRKK
jgi:prolyl oligopeptidase